MDGPGAEGRGTRAEPERPRGGPQGGGTPLVVDLDGALARGNLSRESALGLVSRALPEAVRRLVPLVGLWRRQGRAAVKAALAGLVRPDPALLPWRPETLDLIREARAQGRRTVLVSSADESLVRAAADHLGIFDEAHGSDGRRDLAGRARADFLAERFGPGGFDYVGDAAEDLPVWVVARRAVTVAAPQALVRAVEAQAGARAGTDPHAPLHLAPPEGGAARLRPWLRAIRPHQWSKNLLVFAPLLAEHRLDAEGWTAAALAFLAFCLAASSAYLLNDLLDLEADRAHPDKRHRPFAAGELGTGAGGIAAALLLAGALAAAGAASAMVLGVTAFYYGATLLYSLALKRELVIDICVLAGLYSLRVIAGAVAVGSTPSPWMLAFCTFLFLSLAAMKRQTELVGLPPSDPADAADTPAARRAAGRAYRAEDLPVVTMMAIAAGYTAVLVLALYIYTPGVRALYAAPMFLWGAPPILLYWISRMVMIAHRGGMPSDPVLFALRDRVSLACVAGTLAAAALADRGL